MRLIDERKKTPSNDLDCFNLHINMKNYKSIACTDFVNVNIGLNLKPEFY